MKFSKFSKALALCGIGLGSLNPGCASEMPSRSAESHSTPPVIKIDSFQGFHTYTLMDWEDGTTVDARGAHWLSFMWGVEFRHASVNDTARNNYPIQLGADWNGAFPARIDLYNFGLCPDPVPARLHWIGGVVEGVAPLNATWTESKASNGGGITLNGIGCTLDSIRLHNLHDSIIPLAGNDFVIKDSWISYNRDDAIENDGFAAGLIDNCLFDGTFVFYSGRNTMHDAGKQCEAPGGGSESVIRVQNTLVAMKKLPGSNNVSLGFTEKGLKSRQSPGWGAIWKMGDHDANGHDRNPQIELVNDIFYIPEPPEGMNPRFYDPKPSTCILSEGNVVIWMGRGEFPFKHEGFTVLTGEKGQAYWDQAKQDWIDAHPQVARVKGDPGWKPQFYERVPNEKK